MHATTGVDFLIEHYPRAIFLYDLVNARRFKKNYVTGYKAYFSIVASHTCAAIHAVTIMAQLCCAIMYYLKVAMKTEPLNRAWQQAMPYNLKARYKKL
jgi:hypothetical protein